MQKSNTWKRACAQVKNRTDKVDQILICVLVVALVLSLIPTGILFASEGVDAQEAILESEEGVSPEGEGSSVETFEQGTLESQEKIEWEDPAGLVVSDIPEVVDPEVIDGFVPPVENELVREIPEFMTTLKVDSSAVRSTEYVDYFNEKVDITIEVYSEYFLPGSEETKIECKGDIETLQEWEQDEFDPNLWSYKLRFKEGLDNEIKVTAFCSDGVTDVVTYGTHTQDKDNYRLEGKSFSIDLTAPEVLSIGMNQEATSTEAGVDRFEGSTNAIITAKDGCLDTQENSVVRINDNEYSVAWHQVGEDEGVPVWESSVGLPGREASTLEVIVYDMAGNSATMAYGDIGTCDSSGSSLSGPSFAIETSNLNVAFRASEEFGNPSGIGSSAVDYVKNDVDITIHVYAPIGTSPFDPTFSGNLISTTGTVISGAWTYGYTPGIGANWSQKVSFSGESSANAIYVEVFDMMGDSTIANFGENIGRVSTMDSIGTLLNGSTFVVDKTNPIVDVSLNTALKSSDASDPTNRFDYFDASTTASIVVTDQYFDAGGTTVDIYKNGVLMSPPLPSTITFSPWVSIGNDPVTGVPQFEAKIAFNSESNYDFIVNAIDHAGNSQMYNYGDNDLGKTSTYDRDGNRLEGHSFTVDTEDPRISKIELNQPRQHVVGSVDYYGADLEAKITVEDVSFKPEDAILIKNGGTIPGPITWNYTGLDTTTGLSTWTTEVNYYEGIQNNISIEAKDWVSKSSGTVNYGDTTTRDSMSAILDGQKEFVVDTSAPEIRYEIDQDAMDTYSNIDFFSNYSTLSPSLNVKIIVEDVCFDESSANTAVVQNGTTIALPPGSWTLESTDLVSGKETWSTTVSYTGEVTPNKLDVSAGDYVGLDDTYHYGEDAGSNNTIDRLTNKLTGNEFILDFTAPIITNVVISKPYVASYGTDEHFFYNDNTTIYIAVADNLGLNSATLDNVFATYTIANSVAKGDTSHILEVNLEDGYEFDRAIILTVQDIARNERTWSIAPDGTVKDITGSSFVNRPLFDPLLIYPLSVIKDTVAPSMAFSGVMAGGIYNETQTVSLDVREFNFRYLKQYDETQEVITVTKRDASSGGSTSTSKVPVADFSVVNAGQSPDGFDGRYYYSEAFETDGHYSLSAELYDPATNRSTAYQSEFTIDKTAPMISVTYDNDDVRNGFYYNRSRTATIEVDEYNFDPSLINISTNGSIGSWASNGDTHSINVFFGDDGAYNLSVSGRDLAGNEAEPYTDDEFIIDTISPTVVIERIEDSHAYNGAVEPVIRYSDDANFDLIGTDYVLTGNNNGVVNYLTTIEDGENSSVITFMDFDKMVEVDDIYTLYASVSDLAGNQADAIVTFSVNRFGSNFRIVDEDKFTANKGYLGTAPSVTIEEINVSGCIDEAQQVSITRGVETTQLKRSQLQQQTGFILEGRNDDRGWAIYTYRIPKGNFTEDGKYHVAVSSVDTATNRNVSTSYFNRDAKAIQGAEVSFVLDTTDPVISNLNINNFDLYDVNNLEGTFSATDNIGFDKVVVYLDNEVVEAQSDGYGNYTFSIPAKSFTPRSAYVSVTDYVGREAVAQASGFRVTTHIVELYLWWLVAAAGAVAALITVIIILIRRKRDKKKEQTPVS